MGTTTVWVSWQAIIIRNPLSEASTSGGEETGSSSELAAAERELRLRYHHAIHGALDKQVRNDQQHQMKALTVSTAIISSIILTEYIIHKILRSKH